jgi:hypothetical protein
MAELPRSPKRRASPRYTSFLLRYWSLGDGQRRIQIEQVQSGAGTRVATLAAALEWIEQCCGETSDTALLSWTDD